MPRVAPVVFVGQLVPAPEAPPEDDTADCEDVGGNGVEGHRRDWHEGVKPKCLIELRLGEVDVLGLGVPERRVLRVLQVLLVHLVPLVPPVNQHL